MKTHPTRGRAWAYAGAILGGAVSVAANVAHSFIPPHNAPATWSPEPGAVVGAIVWPVFLFIAVEILARTVWPAGKAWTVLRFGGLLPVAAVAAFVSYRHLSGLLAHYGEEPIVYLLGPIAVDGLMLMATGALLAINHRTHTTTTTTTTPAPATSAAVTPTPAPIPAQPTPAVVPALVPVPAPGPAVVPAVPASVSVVDTPPVPVPAVVPPAVVHASPLGSVPAVAVSRPLVTVDESAKSSAVKRPAQASAPSRTDSTAVPASGVASPAVLPVSAALLTRATHLANAHLATTGAPITAGELAVKLRVGTAVASQVLAVLNLRTDSPTTPTSRLNGSAVSGVSR